jgi:hypothetical protein
MDGVVIVMTSPVEADEIFETTTEGELFFDVVESERVVCAEEQPRTITHKRILRKRCIILNTIIK